MGNEHIKLFEAVLIKQKINAFARGELAFGVLCINPLLAAALACRFASRFKFLQNIFHHQAPCIFRRSDSLYEVYRKVFLSKFANICKDNFANLQIC